VHTEVTTVNTNSAKGVMPQRHGKSS